MQQTQSTTTPADTSPRRSLPLPSPTVLRERLPVDARLAAQIQAHRQTVRDILNGTDDRLLVITGPCSLHDPKVALEYGHRLSELSRQLDDKVFLVMRAYVEKPRTTVGWKGMLYDPHLDGSNDIGTGLNVSRHLLLDLARLGLPLATELCTPWPPTTWATCSAGQPSAPAPPNPRSTGKWSAACPCPWASRTAPMAALM
jgi:3-deoxy-7-phosphoheptulonate synthase